MTFARQKRRSNARVTVPEAKPPRLMLARAPLWHRAAEWLLHALAFSAVVAIVLILVFIAKEAVPILYSKVVRDEVTLAKMWWPQLWPGYDEAASVWQPVSDIPKFGLWPLILGTLKVTIVAMAVSVPLGVGAAVFVSQYARPRVAEIVKPVVELLAGIPSVVLGFFALMVMASWFQDLLHLESRLNALVSGVALSFAVIPVIFTLSEEALRAVPRSYVEASIALGAARWQTIARVILPAASPGHRGGRRLGAGARRGRDDDRADGVRQRGDRFGELRRLGPHDRGHDRGRARGGRVRRCSLHGSLLPRHASVPGDIRHQQRR